MKIKKFGLVGLCVFLASGAWGSDLTKGYTFSSGEQNVTHTKLNNLVDLASINTSFLHGQSAVTAATLSGLDELLLYSSANAAYRKTTVNTFLLGNTNLITGQTADTAPASSDLMLSYSVSGGGLRQVTRAKWLNTTWETIIDLDQLSVLTTPGATDEIWIRDNSIPLNKRMTFANLSAAIVAAVPSASFVTNNSDLVRTDSHYTTGIYKSAADVTISTGIPINNVAHSLGAAPQSVRLVLVCQSTDLGYNGIGAFNGQDEVDVSGADDGSGLAVFSFGANTDNVWAVCRTTTFDLLNKSTGAHSPADSTKWKLRIYAARLKP